MAIFDPSHPTTEREAVSTMMVAIGQPPLPATINLADVTDADVVTAINTLSKTCKDVLSEGWRFNTLYGYELLPSGELQWTPYGGGPQITLNVFKRPADFLSWRLTECHENGDLDMVERLSEWYQEAGSPIPVLYDRTHNREGADKARYKSIYLDAIVATQWDNLPEAARRYIALSAARRFVSQVVGSPELAGFTLQDEMAALRLLKKTEGPSEKINFLENNASAWQWFGGRPHWGSGRQRRVYRGGTG